MGGTVKVQELLGPSVLIGQMFLCFCKFFFLKPAGHFKHSQNKSGNSGIKRRIYLVIAHSLSFSPVTERVEQLRSDYYLH